MHFDSLEYNQEVASSCIKCTTDVALVVVRCNYGKISNTATMFYLIC